MPIEPGDAVPPATLKQMTPDGIKDVELQGLLSGKKVILFGLPGAYTPVCPRLTCRATSRKPTG